MALHDATLPTERARGCRWASKFRSAADEVKYGGIVTGSPSFAVDGGVTLDGTNDYITYDLNGNEFNPATISVVIEFTPDFAVDTTNRFLLATNDANTTRLYKASNDFLLLYINNTIVMSATTAQWSPYWRTGQRNVLVVTASSGANAMYLNGTQVLTSITAWTPSTASTQMSVGANVGGGGETPMTVHSLKVFDVALTATEAADLYNKATFTYEDNAILQLPMDGANHDPSNVRALDVSGNSNHATLGDGATATTYPTKLAKRGYSYDGGDYMQTASPNQAALTETTFAMLLKVGDTGSSQAFLTLEETDKTGFGAILYCNSTNFQFYSGDTGASRAANSSAAGLSGNVISLIGVHDGTDTKIYVNGVAGTDASSPLAPANTTDSVITVAARGDASVKSTSGTEIYEAHILTIGLTHTQVLDLHKRMMGRVNS